MVDKHFKPKDVLDIFDIKNITKQSLLNYENSGEIPKANRDTKTKIPARFWTSDQLPTIGEKFGFLKREAERNAGAANTKTAAGS